MRRFASFITSLLVLSLLHGVSGQSRALADTCTLGWEQTSFTDPTFEAQDVSARTASDVWVVGNTPLTPHMEIQHWDGTSWNNVPAPSDGGKASSLVAVSAVDADEAWAVGVSGGLPTTVRWNGSTWSTVPPQLTPGVKYTLKDVAAVSGGLAWAVGTAENNDGLFTLVEHFDGTAWHVVPSPSPNPTPGSVGPTADLVGVSANTDTNVWGVGSYVDGGHVESLVEHWDGSSWTVVPDEGRSAMSGVVAAGSTDAWSVGTYDDSDLPHPTFQTFPFFERWDGSSWSEFAGPDVPAFHSQAGASSVDATGPDDVWVLGNIGLADVVEHWDGTGWTVVRSVALSPAALSVDSSGGVWVVRTGFGAGVAEHLCDLPTDVGDVYTFTPPNPMFGTEIGTRGTFEVNVWNAGPGTASDVKLRGDLPTYVVFAHVHTTKGSCDVEKGKRRVRCDLGDLAAGQYAHVEIDADLVRHPHDGGDQFHAVASTPSDPYFPSNNDDYQTLFPKGASCTIVGTQHRDVLRGTQHRDVICGLGGRDVLRGRGGGDILYGGTGRDRLYGGAGNDTLVGGAAKDACHGGKGRNTLRDC